MDPIDPSDAAAALGARLSRFAICPGDLEADALAQRLGALRPDWWVARCRLGGPWPDA